MRDLRTTVGIALLVTSLVLGAPAYGQKIPTGPLQPVPIAPDEKKATTEEQEHAIKVRMNEVIVPVNKPTELLKHTPRSRWSS